MAGYTPPAGDQLAFDFTESGYAAPAGDSLLLEMIETILIELDAGGLVRVEAVAPKMELAFGLEAEALMLVLGQAPAVPLVRKVSGAVRLSGSPVARAVRLYKRGDGGLVAETTSSAVDGSYEFATAPAELCYVVVLDDETGDVFNALILDRIKPGQDFD